MSFPITELVDDAESSRGVAHYFHPQGFRCPYCQTGSEQARVVGRSKRGFVDYRCKYCERVYNLYPGTVFAGCGLSARPAVLRVRGVGTGASSATRAEELGVGRSTVHPRRQKGQATGSTVVAEGAWRDPETETAELVQKAGENRAAARQPRRSATATGPQGHGARHL